MSLPEENRPVPWRIPLGHTRIAGLCGLFLASFYFPLLLSVAGISAGSSIFPWFCLGGTVLFLIGALLICSSAGPLAEVLGPLLPSRKFLLRFPLWLLLIFIAGAVAGSLWIQFLERFHYPAAPQELQKLICTSGTWGRLGFFFQVTVAVPAFEELIFRRGIYELLRPCGAIAALLGTAAIFSGVHFYLPGTATLFCYGVGFLLAYGRTGSLLSSMLLHGALNGITFCAILCE